MLLGEPSPTPYDLRFTLAGVPVRVHPWFWLVSAILGYSGNATPAKVLIWIGVSFVSILVHEMGHVLAFRRYGVSSHVVLYGMGGLAVPHAGSMRGALPQIVVSLAGPFAGFALAAVVIVALRLSGHYASVEPNPVVGIGIVLPRFTPDNLYVLCRDLLLINVFWGAVNLLPVLPLDGGRATQAILIHFNYRDGQRQALMLGILAGAGIAIYAYTRLGDPFIALMFGYLAFMNYQMLQAYGGMGGR